MTGTGLDYQLLLPPGWLRLPLDDKVHERLVTLSAVSVRGLPTSQRESARNSLVHLLSELVHQAEGAGATDLLVSVAAVNGIPVSASCLVTYLAGGAVGVDGMLDELTELGGEVAIVEVAGAKAVRRHTRRELAVQQDHLEELGKAAGVSPERLAAAPVPVTEELTYLVPLPGRTDLLVFSFSSVQPELADALRELFDAIMKTLRWMT